MTPRVAVQERQNDKRYPGHEDQEQNLRESARRGRRFKAHPAREVEGVSASHDGMVARVGMLSLDRH
jgi:hypothetical protein